MIRRIYNHEGDKQLRVDNAEQECGKDFCDQCGDCLACYPDECWDGGEYRGNHLWIHYESQNAETGCETREASV